MSAFVRRQSVVHIRGRRIVCRPPTVATVLTLIEYYAREIRAAARSFYHEGGEWVRDGVEDLLPLFLADGRCLEVLRHCTDLEPGDEGVPTDVVEAVSRAVIGMCSPGWIAEQLELREITASTATPEGEEDPAPCLSAIEAIAIQVARAHGCSPFEIMDWPYEAFMLGLDVFPERDAEPEKRTGAPPQLLFAAPPVARA